MKTCKCWNFAAVYVAMILLIRGVATAATYTNYVALTGSDGNGGTSWVDAYGRL